jgi:hypothetical protein
MPKTITPATDEPEQAVVPHAPPVTGREHLQQLKDSGFVGMWKDRKDIGDSSEFARRLRESVEARADRCDREETAQ